MKLLQLSAFAFLFPFIVFAQGDWGAFVHIMDAKPYQGKKFIVQAAVKVQTIDTLASGEIWVRVDDADKKMGFFYNMMDKPIRLNEWKIYTISGRIDKKAEKLNFGGLYQRKGLYWFDDFKLFIEGPGGKMEEVPLQEGGFEGDTVAIHASWGYLQRRAGVLAQPVSNQAYAGKQSFLVDASRLIVTPAYGSNDSAGKYVQVGAIRMYYETYGQGEPLLLLHGNSA
ncbi:MAG TPA: hypothetical protein VLD19_04185, partial [Chitinophagaceae bacterium]|nr:hypothetical protein [Chitinophagaceae bacterium]